MDVKDKVVIVTGASSGIGLATARLLAEKGAKVALVSRSRDKLEELSRSIPNSFAVAADMTSDFEIISMVGQVEAHFGRIDILVNNAGIGYDSPVENINVEEFNYVFDLDVVGPLVAMQEVIPTMRTQGCGAIVNVSSALALMNVPNMSGYASMKRALVGISLAAREELKKDGISVGVVYPYVTLTNFDKNTLRSSASEGAYDESKLPSKPDTAEFVAQKILECIESGEAEIFAHDWMKKLPERRD